MIKKIALVTVTQMDFGIRTVSGILKKEGFGTGKVSLLKDCAYTNDEINAILNLLSRFDFIAFTATDYGFGKIVQLVKTIKDKIKKPTIIGGVKAIMDPSSCLRTGADAVCLGDAENGFAELLNNWEDRFSRTISNFVVKEGDLNNVDCLRMKPAKNLDQFTPDFSYDEYYFLKNGELINLTPDLVETPKQHLVGHKKTLFYTSQRGCPNSCNYCYNNEIKKAFSRAAGNPVPYLRMKSIEKMIEELIILMSQNPEAKFMGFADDDMAARTLDELEQFGKLYKKHIKLPFFCALSPQQLKGENGRKKIEILSSAGMTEVCMGIQTNEKTNQLYNRFQSDQDLIEACTMLAECSGNGAKFIILYDFIFFSPFETEEDVKRTIKLIKQLPKPFDVIDHCLFLGGDTVLRKKYEAEKTRLAKIGKKIDVVVEDNPVNLTKVSNFHDYHTSLDWLSQNNGFVINLICGFLSGKHDSKMSGRIPFHTSKLIDFDVFNEFIRRNHDFGVIIKSADKNEQSIDFLISDRVLQYFKSNIEKFKILVRNMHCLHPRRLSNQTDNY